MPNPRPLPERIAFQGMFDHWSPRFKAPETQPAPTLMPPTPAGVSPALELQAYLNSGKPDFIAFQGLDYDPRTQSGLVPLYEPGSAAEAFRKPEKCGKLGLP